MLSQKGYKAFNNDKWLSLRDKENEALKTKKTLLGAEEISKKLQTKGIANRKHNTSNSEALMLCGGIILEV